MLVIADEVKEALNGKGAVVALESTIVAHGLPYPDNLELAQKLEETVRQEGAIPATIAVFEGRPHVGLEPSRLQQLAESPGTFRKAGSADLPVCIALGHSAATTVSATSTLAARAGIRVFATGGIGGAHRGDLNDVSADLLSLSRLPVAVVSAGPKAILDLPRTSELLESLQVPIIGYETDALPAFYCRDSEVPLDHRCDSVDELAKVVRTRFALGQGGLLIANPCPADAALSRDVVEDWIDRAHEAAEEEGVRGKALTPFLLAFLAKHSGGRSITANRALARNNARVAAKLAVALGEPSE